MLKKFKIILLTLIMVLALGVCLASCTDDSGSGGSAKDTYTVTVKDSDGNPVEGVELCMVAVKDKEIPNTQTAKKTDAEGKATFEVASGNWKVQVKKVSSDYVEPTANFAFTNKSATITLEKVQLATYTVELLDQYGDPVVGARVQMCLGTLCTPFAAATDDSGQTSKKSKVDEYKAQISVLPNGYTADTTEYHPFDGSAESGFYVTIYVTKN